MHKRIEHTQAYERAIHVLIYSVPPISGHDLFFFSISFLSLLSLAILSQKTSSRLYFLYKTLIIKYTIFTGQDLMVHLSTLSDRH